MLTGMHRRECMGRGGGTGTGGNARGLRGMHGEEEAAQGRGRCTETEGNAQGQKGMHGG